MKVKKNDSVLVLQGKDNGKTGKVLRAYPDDNKIVVDGINLQKRHKKAKSAKETSAITEQAGAIDASNVLVVCPACGKATRVAYKIEGDKKIRICKKCGAALDVKVEAKSTKKATKKADKAVKAPKEETADKTAKKASKKKTDAEKA